MYHLTRIAYDINQPKDVCIKVFAPRCNHRIPFVLWVWKSVEFQERKSYDVLGIIYDNILNHQKILGIPLIHLSNRMELALS